MSLQRAVSLFCFFILIGCAHQTPNLEQSSNPAVGLTHFLEGLKSQTDSESAQKYLESSCQSGEAVACDALGKKTYRYSGLAILQGATDAHSAYFIAMHPENIPVQLVVWGTNLARPILPVEVVGTPVQGQPFHLSQYLVEELELDTLYTAQWVTPDGKLLDSRRFKALNIDKRQTRIAVASCMDDSFKDIQQKQWEALLSEKPEVIFLIGDTVYADHEVDGQKIAPMTPPILWRRFAETRNSLYLFHAEELVPILAIWDDHDFGENDGDSTFVYKEAAKEVFLAFFGAYSNPGILERGPGVSFRWSAFGQNFYFLDDRTFRTSPEAEMPAHEQKGSSHFGRDSEYWLMSGFEGRTPTWLISGDQFFGGYHSFESYEGNHPISFDRFITRLKNKRNPVVFLSGDRHLSEVMKIDVGVLGAQTYELTTSGIHAKMYPGSLDKDPNTRRFAGQDGEYNFMILDVSTEGKWEIDVRARGEAGRSLYRLNLLPSDPETRPEPAG